MPGDSWVQAQVEITSISNASAGRQEHSPPPALGAAARAEAAAAATGTQDAAERGHSWLTGCLRSVPAPSPLAGRGEQHKCTHTSGY